MTEYLTEQEQVELLKSWIKQYALVILAGMGLALLTVSAWRYWQERQLRIMTHASSVYDEMLTVRAQNDADATVVQAKKLYKHYPQTVYGKLSSLMLARQSVVDKDYQKAERNLQSVIDNSKAASFRQIARIRLARVFIADNKPEQALAVLKKTEDKTFNGLTEEVRGDAYLAMKDTANARKAYGEALNDLPNAEIARPVLQMKYDNLATTETES